LLSGLLAGLPTWWQVARWWFSMAYAVVRAGPDPSGRVPRHAAARVAGPQRVAKKEIEKHEDTRADKQQWLTVPL
jgi:hypothetical protein